MRLKTKWTKRDGEGCRVTLLRSSSAEWYIDVGSDARPPLGAFASMAAAQAWADRHNPGGTWRKC